MKKRAKLIAARLNKGWSQEALAEKVGVARNTVSAWERGLADPYPLHVQRLCHVFATSVAELDLTVKQGSAIFEDALEMVEVSTPLKGNYSRRQAISLLASVYTGLLCNIQATQDGLAEDILMLCSTGIVVCWNLFWEGDFAEVEKSLPIYLTRLAPLTQRSSSHQRRAASLISQAHQIASLLVLEQKDFYAALTHCKQAFFYGELAGDSHLQVAALIRQANVYFYQKYPQQILHTYQQALLYLKLISPLLRSRVYSGISSVQAELGQQQEALRYAGLAHEEFPTYPEEDCAFLYTNTTRYILHFNDASAYLSFHQPQQAWEALQQATRFVPNETTPRGMELQNYRVLLSVARGTLEQSIASFEQLVASCYALRSDLHYNEARTTYQQMHNAWPHEHRVKQLEALLYP